MQAPDSRTDPEVLINGTYFVSRISGCCHSATIIDSRTSEQGKTEYFVHYRNRDRRLDEWVPLERIDVSRDPLMKRPPPTPSPSHEVGRFTRNQKRRMTEFYSASSNRRTPNSPDSSAEKLELEHQEFTRIKFIDYIQFGKYEIDTWYFSPFPEEYRRLNKLWICEYCLKYMKSARTWVEHVSQVCKQRQPPGKRIYHKGSLTVFELDGQDQKLYCQNLCLLAKLFLDHKTLYYDVAPFMFYVLCESDREGYHVVGYFSKEKMSADNYNLACILTLPPFQKRGIGRFLITLSYELAKLEHTIGTPEKPLSDLGRVSYRSYWEDVIFHYLLQHPDCSISEISEATSITEEDILWTLKYQRGVQLWRAGFHAYIQNEQLEFHLRQLRRSGRNARNKIVANVGSGDREAEQKYVEFDVSCLRWNPPIKPSLNSPSA